MIIKKYIICPICKESELYKLKTNCHPVFTDLRCSDCFMKHDRKGDKKPQNK